MIKLKVKKGTIIRYLKVTISVCLLLIYSCNSSEKNQVDEGFKSSNNDCFSENSVADGFKLTYSDKNDFGPALGILTGERLKENIRRLKMRDDMYVKFNKGFDNDTISLFNNRNLMYYSASNSTNKKSGFASLIKVKRDTLNVNYLTINFNNEQTYCFKADYDYFILEIDKYDNGMSACFRNDRSPY